MRTTRQKHKSRAKEQEKRSRRRETKRARGLEERVLLNVASGFDPGFNSHLPDARIAKVVVAVIEKGWLSLKDGELALTAKGKEAAGLVLQQVPIPKHLADLIKPEVNQ